MEYPDENNRIIVHSDAARLVPVNIHFYSVFIQFSPSNVLSYMVLLTGPVATYL